MDTLINNKSCVCKTKHYAYYACKTHVCVCLCVSVCVCAQCTSSGGVTLEGTSWSSHPEPGFLNNGKWITNPNDFAVDVCRCTICVPADDARPWPEIGFNIGHPHFQWITIIVP